MALKRWTLMARALDDYGEPVELEVEATGNTPDEAKEITTKTLGDYRYEEIQIGNIRESDPTELDPNLLKESCELLDEDMTPEYPEPPGGRPSGPVLQRKEQPQVVMFLINRPEWKEQGTE